MSGAGQELAAYDYNFDRKRIAKTIGSASQTYVYGGDQVVNEYGQNNQLLNRYDLGAGDVVRAELNGEGERYYFSDGQGSITSLARTQGTAALTARYEYDAWGQYLGAAGASFNAIGYTGQRVDNETGLMPLGNGERYYSPAVGSFIQQDSFAGVPSVTASLNRYSYVHGNPVKHTDPSGHVIPLIPILLAVGAAIIVGTGTHRAHAEHNLEGDLQGWAHDDPRRSVRSAFGDGTGMTKIVNWASQQDVYTGRDLSLSEARWQGAFGVVEVVGNATAVGGALFKGGSFGINLARGSEEAVQGLNGFTRSLSFKPALADLRSVGNALRHPIQTGKAVASSVAESYSAIGGARGALKEAWSFTRQEALPRLNPRNYAVEMEGWSNVNVRFAGRYGRQIETMVDLVKRDVEGLNLLPYKQRGPVVARAFDKGTGTMSRSFVNASERPTNLFEPLLERSSEAKRLKLHYSEPGTHAEVLAVDSLIKSRQARGMIVTERDLGDFVTYQEWLNPRSGPAMMCENCSYILPEVESLPGKHLPGSRPVKE